MANASPIISRSKEEVRLADALAWRAEVRIQSGARWSWRALALRPLFGGDMKFIRFAKAVLAVGLLVLSVYSVAPHSANHSVNHSANPSTLVADDPKPGTGGG